MTDDAQKDLEALAAIQAIEAAPLVREFREQWLPEGLLAWDNVQIASWVLRHGTSAEDVEDKPAERSGSPVLEFQERDDAGELAGVHWLDARPGTAIGDLRAVVRELERLYLWSQQEAIAFALSNAAPIRETVCGSLTITRRIGVGGSTPASTLMTQEIVLRCRLQATQKAVAAEYERLRRLAFEREGLEPGDRNRSTSSERTRDFAILGARIVAGCFGSTAEAVRAWLSEHPEDRLVFCDSDGELLPTGRFRLEVKRAYSRITGHDIDFRTVFHPAPAPGRLSVDQLKQVLARPRRAES